MAGVHGTLQHKIKILPKARTFAVVRMDPISMVSHLKLDAIAVEEATAMKPKKYLVYLETPQDLPLPTSEWCRYWAEPVATTLRPAVPEQGIESDMVLPIYPNTQYAKGRNPVHSISQFPFPNCYFWIESTTSLRVRVKRGAEFYDNDHSTRVSISEQVAFVTAWNEDSLRMFSLRRASAAAKASQDLPQAARSQPPMPQHDTRHLTLPSTPSIPPSLRALPVSSSSADDDEGFMSDASSRESDGSSSPTSEGGTGSTPTPKLPPVSPLMELAISMDVFGWTFDPKVPFIPLVDVWLELEDHLSLESIPSPTELWREQETIGTIIEAALKRRATATVASQVPPPRGGDQKSAHPVVSPGPGAVNSSRTGPSSDHDSRLIHQYGSTDHLDSTPPSRPPPFPARARLTSPPVPNLQPGGGVHKDDARGIPPTTFASLFYSVAPQGSRVASWGFRSSRGSSQPAPSAPAPRAPTSRPQSSPSPRFSDRREAL